MKEAPRSRLQSCLPPTVKLCLYFIKCFLFALPNHLQSLALQVSLIIYLPVKLYSTFHSGWWGPVLPFTEFCFLPLLPSLKPFPLPNLIPDLCNATFYLYVSEVAIWTYSHLQSCLPFSYRLCDVSAWTGGFILKITFWSSIGTRWCYCTGLAFCLR